MSAGPEQEEPPVAPGRVRVPRFVDGSDPCQYVDVPAGRHLSMRCYWYQNKPALFLPEEARAYCLYPYYHDIGGRREATPNPRCTSPIWTFPRVVGREDGEKLTVTGMDFHRLQFYRYEGEEALFLPEEARELGLRPCFRTVHGDSVDAPERPDEEVAAPREIRGAPEIGINGDATLDTRGRPPSGLTRSSMSLEQLEEEEIVFVDGIWFANGVGSNDFRELNPNDPRVVAQMQRHGPPGGYDPDAPGPSGAQALRDLEAGGNSPLGANGYDVNAPDGIPPVSPRDPRSPSPRPRSPSPRPQSPPPRPQSPDRRSRSPLRSQDGSQRARRSRSRSPPLPHHRSRSRSSSQSPSDPVPVPVKTDADDSKSRSQSAPVRSRKPRQPTRAEQNAMEKFCDEMEEIVAGIEEILRFVGVLCNIEESKNVATRAQLAFETERKELLSKLALLQKHRTTVCKIKTKYGLPVEPIEEVLFHATCGLDWSAIPEDWIAALAVMFPVLMNNFVTRRAHKIRTDLPRQPWHSHDPFTLEVKQPVEFTFADSDQAFKSVSNTIGPDFLCMNREALGKKKREAAKEAIVRKYVKRCSVCDERFPDHKFKECPHCLCLGCAQKVMLNARECPICRESVTGFHKIHQ